LQPKAYRKSDHWGMRKSAKRAAGCNACTGP
jgi:hypothetical protein